MNPLLSYLGQAMDLVHGSLFLTPAPVPELVENQELTDWIIAAGEDDRR